MKTGWTELCQAQNKLNLRSLRKKTSPSSARVAAMRSMQQQNHKTKLH